MFCGQEPASYNFGYMVNDYQEGTDFGHHEERQEESAHGEYHTVSYEADEGGFKPQISYEDTEDLTRSGYDSNANNFRSNNGYQGNDQNGGHNQNGGHANARAGAGGYN
ncbi:putative cuticle protein [Operophtera brumata]|uniref:Putative cuticle protein n=1 Tax=Operophtera brumata TaxID=104452 RepID=A0A0L7LTB7_OPEBR|nr:putative cuticle protein [Operophtera brumata]